MILRKRIAAVLRRVDARHLIEWVETKSFDIEVRAQRLAETFDPTPPFDWATFDEGLGGWQPLGYVDDTDGGADAWTEQLGSYADIVERHRETWGNAVAVAFDRYFENMSMDPGVGALFRTPAPALTEETIAKIKESWERHPVRIAFAPAAIRYPVDFTVPTPFADGKFEPFDMGPLLDQHRAEIRRIAEIYEEQFIREVEDVAPGFRQIVTRRREQQS